MDQSHPARADDNSGGGPVERWDVRASERRAAPVWMRPMLWAEDALQFAVAAVLVVVAAAVLVHAVDRKSVV